MKKLFIAALLVAGSLITGSAQKVDTNFVLPKNADVIKYTGDGIRVIASDVYSRQARLKRRIQVMDANNAPLGDAYITLESANSRENMYDKIKNDPGSFSGELTIEVNNQPVYSSKITRGVAARKTTVAGRPAGGGIGGIGGGAGGGPGPVYNPKLRCTIGTVHDCVAYSLETMNWVHFALCLFSAAGCYISTWLSCHWEVCHNHMQYTNPN